MKNVSPSQARVLLKLQAGEPVPRSALPDWLRQVLLEKGACRREASASGRGRLIAVHEHFDRVVKQVLQIPNLAGFVKLSVESTRTEVAASSAHSKAVNVHPLQGGWMMRAIGQGSVRVGTATHQNHEPGTCVFIRRRETSQVEIEADVWVGVENVDTFFQAESLFRNTLKSAVIMLRWNWNESWRRFMRGHRAKVYYLGDYDPKGLAIFVDEILPSNCDARFLVPSDLDARLKAGASERFDCQQNVWGRIRTTDHPDVSKIASLLSKHRRGLDQEHLTSGSILHPEV